ncbi:MAG: hypothetical protein H7239_07225 [Flavobacterium sp.]|nr:hypothetical protein [Flavobacterium sp.]
MKSTILLLFVILASCSKSNPNPNEELPPATQTGAGIFACHVNGQSFIDRSGDVAYYQKIDNDYYFGIGGVDKSRKPGSLFLNSQKKQIAEGQTFQLLELQDGNVYGGAGFVLNINDSKIVNTSQTHTGELKITKLDYTNAIVSGTF